ncbi:hypothetical protein NMY22_g75 [Coprinellus aureogranulatus]|nr:hypothetical protein NMY22_g75 [Coprinellus aureogranulatus]
MARLISFPPPLQLKQRQDHSIGFNRTTARPTRLIRLYKNSRKGLLRQDSVSKVFVEQGLPHPRPHDSRLYSIAPGKSPKSVTQHREVSHVALPIPATMAVQKGRHGVGYDMINIASDPSKQSPKMTAGHQMSTTSAGDLSFTPLPPLPSLFNYHDGVAMSTDEVPTPTVLAASTPPPPRNGKTGSASKMAIPLIVLLSVGVGFVLVGAYLVFRFWARPGRRGMKIRPSLPIREKSCAFDEEAFSQDGRESPVFGGKERSASRLTGDAPLWTWVQYAKPDLKELANNRVSFVQSTDKPLPEMTSTAKATLTSPVLETSSAKKRTSVTQLPLAIAQSNLVSSQPQRNRLSTASFYRTRDSKEIGVAITGDGYPILERSRSKLARRSQSYSALGERRRRDSTYRPDTAYEGADVSSPTTCFQPVATPNPGANHSAGAEGRARIQSAYYAYPRLSSMPASYSIGTARKIQISKAYATEQRSETGADDTVRQGITANSPYLAASPQATLYPDDSMSVIAAGRQKRRSQLDVKRFSKHDALGAVVTHGLLEMDFGVSQMSISELTEGNIKADGKSRSFQSNLRWSDSERHSTERALDGPPRVPSPPPLPSLTQMALAHSNPEAYSNYRSPTYSIYGLYGPEKKASVTK